MSKRTLLTLLILLGLVGGVFIGQYALFDPSAPLEDNHWTRLAGELILIRPLTLLVVPLVFVSVIVGVASIGNPSKLGLLGGSTLLFFLVTMLLAATLGAFLASTYRPGDLPGPVQAELRSTAKARFEANSALAANLERVHEDEQSHPGAAWFSVVRQMVPSNVLEEMAQGRSLGVIVFALMLGLALAAGGEKTAPAVRVFDALYEALLRVVQWIIWLAPVGVMLLVAYAVGKIGLHALVGPLRKYMLIVIGGLAIQGFVILPLLLLVLARRNPFGFMWRVRKALLTAFGSASASATLPVSIESCVVEGGCSRRATNFVVPLGSAINMSGTALYEAVATVFLFQLYGIDLSTTDLVIVVFTATLAAIGAAGLPSAGLVTMVIVITAVNTTLAGRAEPLPLSAMGVIIGVDRILDMCRTAVNAWGNMVAARVMTEIAQDPPVTTA